MYFVEVEHLWPPKKDPTLRAIEKKATKETDSFGAKHTHHTARPFDRRGVPVPRTVDLFGPSDVSGFTSKDPRFGGLGVDTKEETTGLTKMKNNSVGWTQR